MRGPKNVYPYPKMPRVTTAGFSSVSSHFSDTVAVTYKQKNHVSLIAHTKIKNKLTSWSFLLRSSVWDAARTVRDAARALGAE